MATDPERRTASIGGTFYVVLIIFGLLIVIGVIVWMMKTGPGIKHSPQQSAVPSGALRVAVFRPLTVSAK